MAICWWSSAGRVERDVIVVVGMVVVMLDDIGRDGLVPIF